MPPPDFFIVGAPKCGTTALHAYLSQHPDVFLPEWKEPHHFGSDLRFTDRQPADRETYRSLFEPARPGQKTGEASVFYLHSKVAAQEIAAYRVDARILAMFRDPVDVLHSFHAQRVYNGTEDLDFAEALEAEPARKRGERMPPNPGMIDGLFYRDLVDFPTQLQRFFDAFDREQIHVIVYDDFRADPAAAVRDACRHIGVEPRAPDALPVVNPNTVARSSFVRRFVRRRPPALSRVLRTLIPDPQARLRILKRIQRWNTREEARAPMDPDLRARLREEFAPRVERLAGMIDHDLGSWLPERSD